MSKRLIYGLAFAAAGFLAAGSAAADNVAKFYSGKTIKLIAAAGAGGGFGIRARLLAEFLPRHLEGKPSVIADFMPGAGGRKAAAYLYKVAPKDGTEIGILFHNLATVSVVRPKGVRYDPAKFNYLGSQAPAMITVYVWHQAPATTLEGMKSSAVIFGTSSKTATGALTANLLNSFLKTKFKLVFGYRGTADYLKAIEGREIQAALADWDSIVSVRPNWVKEKKVIPVAQHVLVKHPDLPDVPRLLDLVKTDTERKIAEFDALPAAMGHTNVFPPGVPADRVAALRKAIAATYRDPEFLAKAKSLKMDVKPVSGEDVENYVKRIVSYSPEMVAHIRKAYGF